MARVDLRVRLVGRLVERTSVVQMDGERLRAAQQRRLGHNRLTDLIFGPVAGGVELSDSSARGAVGPVAIRTYRPQGAGSDGLPLVITAGAETRWW